MFVDELNIYAKAGDGGNGVVRWLRAKFVQRGGPAGGNGGRGGDVYIRAVRDLNLLSKYTGSKKFIAENGESGQGKSMYGKASNDLIIDVPVGSVVTDLGRERVYEFFEEGKTERILKGGGGGLGNEHFKSSVNISPQESTEGKKGEDGEFKIELSLVVDVGLIGMPNAGKSTLLNTFTNARSSVGAYAFTTVEPHLGVLYGYTIADIPGLIEGAAEGKGLGHKFLRHVTRTKMLLHLVSLEDEDPISSYKTVKNELGKFDSSLLEKEEWIIFTKKDLVNQAKIDTVLNGIDINENRVFVISAETGEGVKELQDSLVQTLSQG
ncbi:MAG: GTPase ObgE, GTP-binding protein [Candidatus Parcubacteria bacterium]|jgi:GTP-binding protein